MKKLLRPHQLIKCRVTFPRSLQNRHLIRLSGEKALRQAFLRERNGLENVEVVKTVFGAPVSFGTAANLELRLRLDAGFRATYIPQWLYNYMVIQ
jgi:hypothetical protein